jgi:hypothetical protein
MDNRRGGKKRRRLDLVREAAEAPPVVRGPTSAEYLDYIAVMLVELGAMSVKADCPALTELLERAHQEAAKVRVAG